MILLMLACTGKLSDTAATESVEELADLLTGLDGTGCDDVDGTAVPGGVSYFWGEFTFSGTQVIGEEHWIIKANDTWIDSGEVDGDCSVVWNAVGNTRDPQACATCDLGLDVTASVDRDRSTCPAGLYVGDDILQESYDVFRGNDGSSVWYFSASGSQFASGQHNTGALNYISAGDCVWF
jgi:hypothetical protein